MVKEIEKKYDHPLAEIVQIASQYKSEILLNMTSTGLMQRVSWELLHLTLLKE